MPCKVTFIGRLDLVGPEKPLIIHNAKRMNTFNRGLSMQNCCFSYFIVHFYSLYVDCQDHLLQLKKQS